MLPTAQFGSESAVSLGSSAIVGDVSLQHIMFNRPDLQETSNLNVQSSYSLTNDGSPNLNAPSNLTFLGVSTSNHLVF